MNKIKGGCHCGNVIFVIDTALRPGDFEPRACDCGFCTKHRASWLSDPKGKLVVSVRDESGISKYRQGSGSAEFMLCRECGVLLGAFHDDGGTVLGAVNSKAVEGAPAFAEEVTVSPRLLEETRKISRWRTIWFNQVRFDAIHE